MLGKLEYFYIQDYRDGLIRVEDERKELYKTVSIRFRLRRQDDILDVKNYCRPSRVQMPYLLFPWKMPTCIK
jgi:hypothetical protein